ncbi:hypothetical protein MMC19_005160 [Ptychographa xylographoides]|nr:hypothetical protein [Ptychographa xylographoides]
MSSAFWHVTPHDIPASHVRGFARGIKDEITGGLRLAVKQYVPISNPEPRVGDVTLIVVHGVGSSKESYEPFMDDLLHSGVRIRAIWTADAAHHGASYALNENIIGDEPNWFDFARDLTHMINHFQHLMPPPLVGVGHSLGNFAILTMAASHPRLLNAVVLIEPATGPGFGPIRSPAKLFWGVVTAKRRDQWPSREVARKLLKKSPFYGSYEARAFERVVAFELRDLPRDTHTGDIPVTLSTPRAMEVLSFLRPDPPLEGFPENPEFAQRTDRNATIPGFYRPEGPHSYDSLPQLYPSTFFVWAENSNIRHFRPKFLEVTGTGPGGNGGVATGKVQEAWVKGANHHVPLEKPLETAQAIAPWLQLEISRWDEERETRKLEPSFEKDLKPEIYARIAKL